VVAADVSDPERAAEAARGAAAIYHCVGADYGNWQQLLPPIMAGVMHAAEATGARLVYGDNLYAYGPVERPLTEVLPSQATGSNGRLRTELAAGLLEAHRAGRLRATIGRASDFFGPRVRLSTVGERVFGALLRGKPAELLGNPDLPHTVTYIYDFAEGLVTLGERDEALGEVWHVPSAQTLSLRQFVGLVAAQAGQRARVQVAPSWIIRFLALFNPTLRAVAEQRYQSERPWVVDHTKFAGAFGAHPTPHPEAIARTLAWYRTA
jgi:nucleoside-diphosphate-sugar epimerase